MKNYWVFYAIKKKKIFFYKMYLILAEGYKNACVYFLRVRKIGKIWRNMKNIQDGLGVKNMSDLILKEIYSIYQKNLTKEQKNKKTQNDWKRNFWKFW